MKTARLILLALSALAVLGCGGRPAPEAPASQEETATLKKRMSIAFAALEMYSVDNRSQYPNDLSTLKPKYLDEIPIDPVSRKPLSYEKTADGFLLSTGGDYSAVQAEPGYPKMNQDGFFALKAADFPVYE